jgi:hypothetical protein
MDLRLADARSSFRHGKRVIGYSDSLSCHQWQRRAWRNVYVMSAVQGFVGDPPDTDSQWGYLSALPVVAKEALGQRMDMSPFTEAQELWMN